MATTTHNGIGVVWGITQTGGTIQLGTATGIGRIVSENITSDSKTMEHLDGNGDLIGVCFYDQRTTIELEVYPSGSTLSNAQGGLNACPKPGDTVVLTDLYLDRVGKTATNYLCMASSIRESNTDRVTISMTLTKNGVMVVGSIT